MNIYLMSMWKDVDVVKDRAAISLYEHLTNHADKPT